VELFRVRPQVVELGDKGFSMSKYGERERLVLVTVVVAVLGGLILLANPTTGFRGIATEVESVRGAVVHIEKVGEWQGSGFIVSKDGLIITAKHVVEGGGDFIVTMDNGTKYTTSMAMACKKYDIGFLKIESDKELPTVKLSDISRVRAGDLVFIMGSPLGYDNFNSVTLGIISSEQRDLEKYDEGLGWTILFQTDSAAYPGNSGGPVFNMQGEVIGILVAGMDASLNYSVPIRLVYRDITFVSQLMRAMNFEVIERGNSDDSSTPCGDNPE
jgi:S1-C subfamily serine protease